MSTKKTMLITGASRGIGKAIAIEAAKNSYQLVITCRTSLDELLEVQKQCILYGVKCLIFLGDMGCEEDVNNLFTLIEKECKGIDILINNAGVSHIGLLSDMSKEQWDSIISTNLSSVFYCSKEASKYMVREKAGKIINISSMWGNVGASCEVAYSASKGGVNAFTKALAKELAPSNIQVNALALGLIDTKMNNQLSLEEKEQLIDEIPAGRMGTSQEIAKLVLTLSDGNEYLTGQIITVDGGMN